MKRYSRERRRREGGISNNKCLQVVQIITEMGLTSCSASEIGSYTVGLNLPPFIFDSSSIILLIN